MADELPYNRVTTHLDIPLHRGANIADAIARHRRFDAFVQAFAGGIHQGLRLFGHVPGGEGGGIVTVIAVKKRSHINADDIARLDFAFVGYAVDNCLVYRDAGAGRKSAVTEERGLGALAFDIAAHHAVNFLGGDTGFDRLACEFERSRRDDAGLFHRGQLPAVFDLDHVYASTAARVSRVVSATSSCPSTT